MNKPQGIIGFKAPFGAIDKGAYTQIIDVDGALFMFMGMSECSRNNADYMVELLNSTPAVHKDTFCLLDK